MRVLDAVESSSDHSSTGAGGAEVILTFAAVAEATHVIGGIAWSYSDTPSGGGLEIYCSDTSEVHFSVNVTAGGPGHLRFDRPLRFPRNAPVNIKLEAPGGAVVGKVNCTSHWYDL